MTGRVRAAAVTVNPPARQDVEDDTRARGAVFTRPWVADMILDLAGYTADHDLCARTAVEPACGTGVFVSRMARRLVESAVAHGRDPCGAVDAIRAFDVSPEAVRASRSAAEAALADAGVAAADARRLARAWVRLGDFLLSPPCPGSADFVVGNPPYVRLEDVPRDTMSAYRVAWPTMTGRSDVYVGFIEAGLRRLRDGGVLAFICADRWMRNQYGAGLRRLVDAEFAVDASVVLHDVDAFENRVAAYPAVVVIRRGEQQQALMADTTADFGERDARQLVEFARRAPHEPTERPQRFRASWNTGWFRGAPSWPVGSPERLAVLADLESRFPPLDAASHTRLGIGVATGADAVLTTTDAAVEPDRLVPLATSRDITDGVLRWGGRYLINPWQDNRTLVSLDRYPALAAHIRRHETRLRQRHVARRDPDRWWRTIDVVREGLADAPKLLLPDLKATVHPVLDPGGHYPSHNLFYVTSTQWDLEVLGGLLLSDVAQMFVEAYSTRMANGCLRVTAQYLRRVRVPDPSSLGDADKQALAEAFRARDRQAATEAALPLYGLAAVPAR